MSENSNINIHIKDINNPHDLKSLNYDQLTSIASEIRQEILSSTSAHGGHLSSNLGVVELTIALHRNFDFKIDKLLFDVGHQCYAHKILTGRDITTLRTKNGVSGFINSNESPYDIFEAGHSSTSLSASLAFAIARDNNKDNYEIVSLIGDASIANGVAFEALNNIPSSGHKVIIVLNDNGMSISPPVGGISKFLRNVQISRSYAFFKKGIRKLFSFIKPIYNFLRKFKNWVKLRLINVNIFDSLGFAYIGLVDGHDFKALDKAFKKAKKANRSVVVHVRTKKGKGYKLSENDSTGEWHGVEPFDIASGQRKNIDSNYISWSKIYSELVYEKLKNDDKFYLICPGTLVGSELAKAMIDFPNKVIDVGISEEHAFIMAAILAKQGYHVCVSIYSTFLQRGYDEIIHDVARINSPITVLVDRSGLIGSDGETHQGIYDSSLLFSIPNINIKMATNKEEAYKIFNDSFNEKQATFIRYPKDNIINKEIDKNFIFRDYKILQDNSQEIAIVSVGPLSYDLLNELKETSISIISPVNLKPTAKYLVDELMKYKKIIIYTPYETRKGFASNLLDELTLSSFKGDVFIKAVPLTFVKHASVNEQLEEFGLLPRQIKEFVYDLQSKNS